LPPQDPTRQIRDAAESGVGEMGCGRSTPRSSFAVNHDFAFPIERLDGLGQGRERNEPGTGNTSDVPLKLLPHIDQIEVLTSRLYAFVMWVF
jgi:hypothetical protein